MMQIRYPNITGKTPEERQAQMERSLRSMVDQLNMVMQKSSVSEPAQKENKNSVQQPKQQDFSKLFASHIAEYWKNIYPVGSIYISVSDKDPTTLFGGTWEQITDTFLLAAGSSYASGSTGGEANHTLSVSEIPSHTHDISVRVQGYSGWDSYTTSGYEIVHGMNNGDYFGPGTQFNSAPVGGGFTSKIGGSQPHNNMPPYLAVYVWKRTE